MHVTETVSRGREANEKRRIYALNTEETLENPKLRLDIRARSRDYPRRDLTKRLASLGLDVQNPVARHTGEAFKWHHRLHISVVRTSHS